MSNWWTNLTRPGFKKKAPDAKPADDPTVKKPETPDGLWIKCPETGELIYQPDLEAANWVTPSGFHMRIGPKERFITLFDGPSEDIPLPKVVEDPLKFRQGGGANELPDDAGRDKKDRNQRYADKLASERKKHNRYDCMGVAAGQIGAAPAVVIVQDFAFMGGSLGMAAGEAFIAAAEAAIARQSALICVAAAGGARMQEGILSLMQMPRTTIAIQKLKAAGLPYLVVLTDPTTGGVTASYAMLGDVHIAEPNALIGFAGPRVIEQTIRQKLPEGFQRSEFLLEKGMVDMVVDRREIKQTIVALLSVLMARQLGVSVTTPPVASLEDARAAQRPNARPQRARAAE
jgi:acetyl-CoA carboxylase carboxyl transferase subunit beta